MNQMAEFTAEEFKAASIRRASQYRGPKALITTPVATGSSFG
jgi:hypothetical protein